MSRALLRKEWREHRGAWLLLGVLFAALMVLLALSEDRYALKGSVLDLLKVPAILLSTGGALFVAYRLVAREYGQRTQLFLESLPLSRARILATKLGLGAVMLLVPLGLILLLLWSRARTHEDISLRFLLIVALRASTPVLLAWSFFALAGLVGRYRNPLYLFLAVAMFAADHLTDFDISKAAPFALLGADFAFERHHIPWGHLLPCWGLTGAVVALCFGLVLHRDGTLAELLSQRMSHREKVFIACMCVGMLTVIGMMDEAKKRKPFALHDAQGAPVRDSTVQVAAGVGFPPEAARRVAERLAKDLGALGEYLALPALPPIAVMPIRELDPDVFQRAKLEEADGVVVRANLADPAFDVRDFEAFLFRELLVEASEGVVLREERQWLLDGFTTWWARRDAEDPQLAPRAALASREDFDTRSWLATRERLGPCLAGALAARGIAVLRAQLGESSFQALARRTLAESPGTGFWGRWREPRLDALLRELGHTSEAALSERWREALRADRDARPELLRELSRLRPSLTLVAESPETFRLEHALRAEEGTAAPGRYALLYHPLDPFTNEVAPYALTRQDVAGSGAPAILPQGLSRGDRWLFVLQRESPELGCPVRLLVERREIR